MGKSTKLVLFNGTPFTWQKNNISHSYQMEQYENNFPDTISPGYGSPNIWVEVKSGAFVNESNTAGEVGYDIQAPGHSWSFQIKVFDGPPRIRFEASGFGVQGSSTSGFFGNGYYSSIDLGYNWDRETYFLLSGNGYLGTSSGMFSGIYIEDFDWMQNSLPYLGQRKLRRICMPGSHDAGMGVITKTDLPQVVVEPITRCQETTIKRQLQLGSRFFDIRPAISGGQFFTGHYSSDNNIGARGQSLSSIIDEINEFTSGRKELVILSISGGRQTDDNFRRFEDKEWKNLMDKLSSGLNYLFSLPNGQEDGSLLDLTLNELIGNKAAVVVVMRDFKDLGDRKGKGFFTWEQFRFRDEYTNTEDLDKMIDDQVDKMRRHKDEDTNNGYDRLSILSWTLTPQSAVSALLAPLVNVLNPIIPTSLQAEMEQHHVKSLAQKANRILLDPTKLFNRVSRNAFPNIIYLDYMDNCPVLALSMAINGYTGVE